jgi:hypothetical protein
MPLFIDMHRKVPEGASVADIAQAHAADLKVQANHGVRYLRYWVDESSRQVFCLVEAPDAAAAAAVHREATGSVADEIYEVVEGT